MELNGALSGDVRGGRPARIVTAAVLEGTERRKCDVDYEWGRLDDDDEREGKSHQKRRGEVGEAGRLVRRTGGRGSAIMFVLMFLFVSAVGRMTVLQRVKQCPRVVWKLACRGDRHDAAIGGVHVVGLVGSEMERRGRVPGQHSYQADDRRNGAAAEHAPRLRAGARSGFMISAGYSPESSRRFGFFFFAGAAAADPEEELPFAASRFRVSTSASFFAICSSIETICL